MKINREALCISANQMNILSVESECGTMTYFVDPSDKRHIGIATVSGKIILTRRQAAALVKEIGGIFKVYLSKEG